MLKEERHNYILEQVRTNHKVLSSELSQNLNVSEDTIRRDLKELSDEGRIRKVHGGALATSYLPFHLRDREIYAHEEKVTIARKAIHLIKDDDVVIIDGGTTNLELVRALPRDLKATFFTNCLPVATQLADLPGVEVIFLGGKILKNIQLAIGLEVIEVLNDIKADICFIGTRSIHYQTGITDIEREETQVKKAIIKASQRVVSLAIAEKLDVVQSYLVCPAIEVTTLVTELFPEEKRLQPYHQAGIEII